MDNDVTADFDGKRPFEERVFARFDALDNRLLKIEGQIYGLDGRVQDLEARGYDTKPIWENALKEILEGRREVKEFKREVTKRLDQIQAVQLSNRADIREIEDRLEKLESTPA